MFVLNGNILYLQTFVISVVNLNSTWSIRFLKNKDLKLKLLKLLPLNIGRLWEFVEVHWIKLPTLKNQKAKT